VLNRITRKLNRFRAKYFLFGKDYSRHCPVCDAGLQQFMPLPKDFRVSVSVRGDEFLAYQKAEMLNINEYACPMCGSSDRERLYALYIQKHLMSDSDINNKKVVHFAPEEGLSKLLKTLPFAQYRTADLMMDNIDDKADLTNLDIYESDYFDFFICSHMLEHIEDDVQAMRELHRILKPAAVGILVVPIFSDLDEIYEDAKIMSKEDRLFHFGQGDHVRMYNKSGYKERLTEAGFKIHEFGVDAFSEDLFVKSGIDTNSVLYIVEK